MQIVVCGLKQIVTCFYSFFINKKPRAFKAQGFSSIRLPVVIISHCGIRGLSVLLQPLQHLSELLRQEHP